MPARYGYGQTKVRNSPAPSKKWMSKAMDGAMEKRKTKLKKKREAVLVKGFNTGNRNK